MICNDCGTKNADNAIFCQHCGRRLEKPGPSENSSAYLPSLPANSGSENATVTQVHEEQTAITPVNSNTQQPSDTPTPIASPAPPTHDGSQSIPREQREPGRHIRWPIVGIVLGVLVLLTAWSGWAYLNRSTPARTLTTACQALKNGDFPTVYGQFSHALARRSGPEPAWAAGRRQDYASRGGLSDCNVGSVSERGSSSTGIVTLTFARDSRETDRVQLLNESGRWVIQSTAIQTPSGTISEFELPSMNAVPGLITAGADGNLWFTEVKANKIAHITSGGSITQTSGNVTEFPIPTANSGPVDITAGHDGNFWFTEFDSGKIGRITPAGAITEFPLPAANSKPDGITAGPDGNLWFTESQGNKIGRITPGGSITEFPLPTTDSWPIIGITAGPDGNLWFTEFDGDRIGRITPAGTITEFPLPTINNKPDGIIAGPDGNLWFTEVVGDRIGRITPDGRITEFPLPTANSGPVGIVVGPDDNLWFSETQANSIGQMGSMSTR